MAKIVGESIFSAIEILLGQKRPMVLFDDSDDEVIRPPIHLIIKSPHWWGWYLNMAPEVSCVVVHPDGHPELHHTGGLKALTPGKYQLIYVDMRQHSASLAEVEAFSKDARRVRLTLDLMWQVRDPLRVWRMSNPTRMLYDRCLAAVVDYIQTSSYDELIATPEAAPADEARITAGILERLRTNHALDGFRFINLSILGRYGDPERTNIMKQAVKQEEKTEQAKEAAEAKLATAKAEQDRAGTTTETQLETGQLTAEYNQRIYDLLLPLRQQLIQLEQLNKSQELNLEDVIRAWEIVSDTAGQIAIVLGQIHAAPGSQPGFETLAVDELGQILRALTSLLTNLSPSLSSETNDDRQALPEVSIDYLGD